MQSIYYVMLHFATPLVVLACGSTIYVSTVIKIKFTKDRQYAVEMSNSSSKVKTILTNN